MGHLEKASAKAVRRGRINNAIIKTLAVSGVIAVGLVAPNVLGIVAKSGLINSSQRRQSIKKSFTRLIGHGYVALEDGKARLTQKGEQFAALLGEGKLIPKKPRRWDGKWRVLIFDIPEKQKRAREQIRKTLIQIGFHRLQDSVWIYPYDCEDLITLLKIDMRIGRNLLYMIVDTLEYDQPMRRHFGLV